MKTKKLEDITSKEFLDKALENAKSWCQLDLPNCLQGFQNRFDYSIFRYIIDNDLFGTAMALDDKKPGLIRVSIRKIKWYQKREEHFRKDDELYGKIREPVEVDPKSMFIHEITEFIVSKTPEVFLHYFPKREFPHPIARQIENINRIERGLKEWPEY